MFEKLYGSVIPKKLPQSPEYKIDAFKKGTVLYHNDLSSEKDVAGWVMEGPGKVTFSKNELLMESPNEKFHHVFWCPKDFPDSFIAEWYVQNVKPEAGLLIVFFAAKGLKGEDLFDSSLKTRNGTFSDYTRGDINNYHISYYANGRNEPGRLNANLRKNKGFNFVQKGRAGIPVDSAAVHKITLIKENNHILLFIDGREVINWTDEGKIAGKALGEGKIGFRQMQWSHFLYHDFTVYELS
ncbi:MAG: DUF1961 family protein [Eubacteriales bacterium]